MQIRTDTNLQKRSGQLIGKGRGAKYENYETICIKGSQIPNFSQFFNIRI